MPRSSKARSKASRTCCPLNPWHGHHEATTTFVNIGLLHRLRKTAQYSGTHFSRSPPCSRPCCLHPGFKTNHGYPTAQHKAVLMEHGVVDGLHRTTYKVREHVLGSLPLSCCLLLAVVATCCMVSYLWCAELLACLRRLI